MPAAARDSANRFDFALVAMLGLLGLRNFEACGANIDDLDESVVPTSARRTDRRLPLPPAVPVPTRVELGARVELRRSGEPVAVKNSNCGGRPPWCRHWNVSGPTRGLTKVLVR